MLIQQSSKQNSVLEGSFNLDQGAQAEQQSEEVTSGKGFSKRSARKSSDTKVCALPTGSCKPASTAYWWAN